jgi:hypothetical protein
MGGWITGVAVIVGIDLLIVGALVAVAASQVRDEDDDGRPVRPVR